MATAVIKHGDLDRMQTMGRLVATKDNLQAFETAAVYLAVADRENDNNDNFVKVWLWFEEGARNYVDGQYHLEAIQTRLKDRAYDISKAGTY